MSTIDSKAMGISLRAVKWSVVLAALGYLAFLVWGGWADVIASIAQVGFVGVGLALALSLFNYVVRFLRWQWYLRVLKSPIAWKTSLPIYLAGFALTTTPGKAGEAIRSVLMRPYGVDYPRGLAVFFSERLVDLLSVVILATVGMAAYPNSKPLVIVAALLIVALLGALQFPDGIGRIVAKVTSDPSSRLRAFLANAVDTMRHARRCFALPILTGAVLLGVLGWAAEGTAFYLLLQLLGAEISLGVAVFIFSFAMLVGALSFLPGGLGSTEVTLVGLLLLHGVTEPVAIAAALLIRLATLWFAVAIGAVTWMFLDTTSRQ